MTPQAANTTAPGCDPTIEELLKENAALRKIRDYRVEDKRAFDALAIDRNEWQARAEKAEAEISRLREALEEIERETSGALNNAFPDEAPDVLAHINGIVRSTLAGEEIK